jgi:hypothetical protein
VGLTVYATHARTGASRRRSTAPMPEAVPEVSVGAGVK